MTAPGFAAAGRRIGTAGALVLVALGMGGCAERARTPPPGIAARPTPTLATAPPSPAPLSFGSAQHTAVACARRAGLDVSAFTACAQERIVLSARQQAVIDCALRSQASQHFAECVAPQFGVTLSKPQIVTADCAVQSGGVKSTFLSCTGTAAAGRRITPGEQVVLGCAAKANDDGTRFAACSAQQILGSDASRERRIALACAAQEGGNYAAFTTCAGANLFNVKLNPDQTVAIECIVQVGGIPSAAVGCMAVRFLTRELRSCTAKGFGGAHGCFGDDNLLIGRNGWTMREVGQLNGQRAAVVASMRDWQQNSRAMRRARDWWTGTGKFVRDPAAYWRGRSGPEAAGQ